MTATQFAYQCLGRPAWPAPVLRRGATQSPDTRCWLCGGAVQGLGWRRQDVLSAAFTNQALARCSSSRTFCDPCAYLISGETWRRYVEAHPERALKAVHPLGWHSFSHVFSLGDTRCGLRRPEIAAILADPPDPPFLLSISESWKKHHIFRGAVATSRESFPVQFEESTLWIAQASYAACTSAAWALFDAGCSRESIQTARYHPATLQQIGLTGWRAMEDAVRPWRMREPDLLRLVLFTFTRPKEAATS